MSKRDVLDADLARRFAFRTGSSPEPEPEPEPPEATADDDEDADDAEEEEEDRETALARWAHASRAAAELARDVERAWATPGRAAQTAATAAVLQRLRRGAKERVVFGDHQQACLRLWRLVVRHFKRLSPRGQRQDVMALVAAAPPLDEPETAELLAEVIAAREIMLTAIMKSRLETDKDKPRHPAVNARLARLLAEGKTWSARETAAAWLSPAGLDDALPALRRALRMPRLALRARALGLLAARTPPALDADDVLWMLRDALAHPMFGAGSNGQADNARAYAEALFDLTVKLRPAGGWEPLLEIVPWVDARGENLAGIDSAWALRLLAAAYPAEGRATIARALLDFWTFRNRDALEAIAYLPDDDARPLLLETAARPAPVLAERAKAIWFARYGVACPVGPLDGVPLSLLDGPPSERFLAAVASLRCASDEARAALLRSALEEAPAGGASLAALTASQREALALWIFAGRDLPRGAAASTHPFSVVDLLAERFGAAAFTGLAVLAERDALAGLDTGWLQCMGALVKKLALTEAERERLRAIGLAGLRSPAWEGAGGPVYAIHSAGLTPETVAVILAAMVAPAPKRGRKPASDAVFAAWQVLPQARGLEGLAEQLAAAARAAWDARSWETFRWLADTACRCGVEDTIALVRRAVEGLDDAPEEARAAIREAARGLEGRVDEAWLIQQLRLPASAAFPVAVSLVARDKPSLAVLEALRDALDSDGRAGASAAEAAEKLLGLGAIGVADRRLDGILSRAPAPARASLAGALLHQEAPIVSLRHHLLDLLARNDYEVVADIFWALSRRDPPGKSDLYEDAVPLATCAKVRRELESDLGEPEERMTYWQGGDGEVDEEEDDDGAEADA
jgi:hypothetical protein